MRHLHRFSFSFFHRQLVSSKCILPKSVARSPSGESSSSVVLKSCYLHSIQMQENRKETRLFKSLSLFSRQECTCEARKRMEMMMQEEDGKESSFPCMKVGDTQSFCTLTAEVNEAYHHRRVR